MACVAFQPQLNLFYQWSGKKFVSRYSGLIQCNGETIAITLGTVIFLILQVCFTLKFILQLPRALPDVIWGWGGVCGTQHFVSDANMCLDG